MSLRQRPGRRSCQGIEDKRLILCCKETVNIHIFHSDLPLSHLPHSQLPAVFLDLLEVPFGVLRLQLVEKATR